MKVKIGMFAAFDMMVRLADAATLPTVLLTRKVVDPPTATVEQAMNIFTEKRCRHLPVVREGAIVGVISIGDVTRWMADTHRAEAEHLRNYIAGGTPT